MSHNMVKRYSKDRHGRLAVTVHGDVKSITFTIGNIIAFDGLETVYMVDATTRDTVTLIPSDTSVPFTQRYTQLFGYNTIFYDAVNVTGAVHQR